MRKLSEIRGEEALDLIAELIDPIAEICKDQALVALLRGKDKASAVKLAIKNHGKTVLKILALLEGKDEKEYNPSVIEIPVLLLNVLNDPDLINLFQSQVQTQESASSGPAMENTEANQK